MNKESFFLILTAIGVATLGIAYGSYPNLNFLPIPFLDNININTTDISNVFSAIMGLYIAMASFWIIGAILVAEIIFALIGYYFLKNNMDKKA